MSLEQQGWEGKGIIVTPAQSLLGTGRFKCRSAARRKQLVSAPEHKPGCHHLEHSFLPCDRAHPASRSEPASFHEPAGTQQSISGPSCGQPLGSGSEPLASNQVTPAGCTDGAAGQNFYKDMCPGQLEGAPQVEKVDPGSVTVSG